MDNVIPFRNWGFPIGDGVRLLIAGPCSAETPEQTMMSCRGAAEAGAHMLRAGIWKPRTRPDAFPGIGEDALPWIVDAGLAVGLPVAVEVASASHVEMALKAGVDVLWIGARSTANPFTVQEIADVVSGVDVPVMIKNPVNPDLDLWLGALERIHRAGVRRLAAVFRGFSVYNPGVYRNAPMWEIPIELRRRLPFVDMICDPSHICGRRSLISDIAQQALDLDFDGLMIETHIDPDNAWSDAAQQLTPEALVQMMEGLRVKAATSDDPVFLASLEAMRNHIDHLDEEIIHLLRQRMEISREIGLSKKQRDITILQMNRWNSLFNSRIEQTIKAGLSDSFAREFIQAIHNESIRQQEEMMKQEIVSSEQHQ